MHGGPTLENIVLLLALSVGVVTVFSRLRVPTIVGFIVVGLLAGPSGFGLIASVEEVEGLAELGVVLLLFSIGLEFSISRIRRIWKLLLEGGLPYVILAGLASFGIARLVGLRLEGSVFAGFWVALSSTAIVLKTLASRGEIDSPHGRLILAILLFQDFCIIPMMLLLPLLSNVPQEIDGSVTAVLVQSGLIVAAVLVVSRYVVPPLLAYVARTRNRELFLLMILLVCLGAAAAGGRLGLSGALGAFLGGLLLSKSEYGMQALSDILPFRDIFNSIFFMSIGMLLNLRYFLDHAFEVSLIGVGILLGKTALGYLITRMIGFPGRVAALTGIALAQVGEFSFVLARTGRELELMPVGAFQTLLAASIFTMIATPILISTSPSMARRVERIEGWPAFAARRIRRRPADEGAPASERLRDHVVVVGYGLNGRNLARLLAVQKIPYVVLDLNAETVRQARRAGEPILFGDITSPSVAHHIGLERARILVVCISDAEATRRAVRMARDLARGLFILVRTRYVAEVDDLYALGADTVVPEEFETSIEIGARTLARYGMPIEQIREQLEEVRADRYRALRPESTAQDQVFREIRSRVASESFTLPAGSPIAGTSVLELDLRGRTGATILAVVRKGETIANPNPSLVLRETDCLVLIGSDDQVEAARAILTGEITIEEQAAAPAPPRAPEA
ncbi:MAG: hypothetical protein GF346_04385 [Candidatus Eisenbacteria bacterium]|nr:hypothetical protein [Candidatus Latescibacterota bacterium]MBD3301665.1 hypothetical protein [Candidatus Eisenbacteria bacterium]